jgi:hypothetical protein
MNVKKWLTKSQWEDYVALMGYACVHKALDTSGLERLVAELAACRELSEQRRVLMEKHQFDSLGMGVHRCKECKASPVWHSEDKYPPCKPDCAWDAALKGVGGE